MLSADPDITDLGLIQPNPASVISSYSFVLCGHQSNLSVPNRNFEDLMERKYFPHAKRAASEPVVAEAGVTRACAAAALAFITGERLVSGVDSQSISVSVCVRLLASHNSH